MKRKQFNRSRRAFLSNAAVIGASGALGTGAILASCSGSQENKLIPLRPASEVYIPDLPDKAIDGKPIKAALIGCGSRGTGAAFNFLDAGDGLSIVALADIFADRMTGCRNRLKEKNNEVADDMCFLGFDAYKKACEAPVDMVIIATPSLFHPDQLKYAIDQGKHVFVEKAAAIDAVGYRTFMVALKQAKAKGLNIVTGTQRHHNRAYVESYRKVQEGYIGRITSGNVYWNQGHMNFARRRPEWTDMEYMFRDFFSWNWLCGDHIIDQGVHNIDVFVWFSHLKPKRVVCMGSRLRRTTGDIYDNFSADIEFEGGVHLHAMARQIDNCANFVGEIIQGTKGSWHSSDMSIRDLDGNVIWQYDNEAAKEKYKQHNDYVLEHLNLVNHIRSGKVINIAEITAISSMTGIMARESAYSGKAITWDEMTNSDLNLMPEQLTLGNVDMKKYEAIPLPGTPVKA
ncbi:MAG: Gfo/Idh/MocA family oxidoreductase [Bacteroidales bacterium]|jgi:predicted dehydrogenase|nr:Gfo/Idh/MocA family oxidoreductase [Bacteroidales bacterium]